MVHNHLHDTEVSEGDVWAKIGHNGMDSILAVRGNGRSTAIVGHKLEGYNFINDNEYWDANSKAHADKLTVEEKDRKMRDVIIKNAGLRLIHD